jgi:cytochrome c5
VVLGGQVTLSTGFPPGKRQAQALALWSTAPFVGVGLGTWIAAPFADGKDWGRALLVEAVLAAIGIVLVIICPRSRAASAQARMLAVFRVRPIVRLAIAFGLISLVGQGSNSVVSLYLSHAHTISVGAAATMLGLANLAGIIGSFAMGAAISRGIAPRRLVWIIAIAGMIAGTLTYTPAVGLYPAIAGLTLWTIVMGATVAFVYTLVPLIVPSASQIGAGAGLVNQGSGVGIIFAAPLFLSFYASGQWPWFLAVIAMAWLALLLLAPVRGLTTGAKAVPSAASVPAIVIAIAGLIGAAHFAARAEAATPKEANVAVSGETARELYNERCGLCHERGAMGALMLAKRLGEAKSDLANRQDLPADYVLAVVRHGLAGMPYFTRVELSDEELTAIATFLSRNTR